MQDLTLTTRRPPAVSIVVLIFILNIIVTILRWVVVMYQSGVLEAPNPLGALQALLQTNQGLIQLAQIVTGPILIVIFMIATLGLYRLWRWAWTLAMLLLGIDLAVNLFNLLRDDPAYLAMLVRVIAVILLDQEPVRFAFGKKVGGYE
jgi:hypothetical protein